MGDIICKIKVLVGIRRSVLLIFVILFFNICGCSSKSTVTYIPPEERVKPPAEQVRNDKKMGDATSNKLDKSSLEALKKHFISWKGTRYRYGGLSRKGVDCSGFTLLTYKELFGTNLPRTVKEQVKKGKKVQRSSLQPGDLVFFKTGVFQKHVGIYLEKDRFMHASRSSGVMISRLDNSYWNKRYWQAKRI